MTKTVLVLNAGSSSIKFASYPVDAPPKPVLAGAITGIGRSPKTEIKIAPDCGRQVRDFTPLSPRDDQASLIKRLLPWIEETLGDSGPVAAGHRVVHGGKNYGKPALINGDVLKELEALTPLAPGHQPHNIAGIQAVAAARPDIPQVACFDTAFHRTQPRLSQIFAIPRILTEEGIIRYGFHGLSYEYIASVLPHYAGARADGRVIIAHLGHGASLCAMHERKSVATSMGFTALDGLVMGKRPGMLDPGVVLHLLKDKGMSVDEVADLLHNRSGLLGVSELSDDMRDLLASGDIYAEEAVDLFVARAVREIGALAAVLGGIDLLVFTAGIGENTPEIRARICEGSQWLGVDLDSEANHAGAPCITDKDSRVSAWVIPTDEERIVALHTVKVINSMK